jgi:cysteine desulfurase/selenocysteine lyase
MEYENPRGVVQRFIHATSEKEIVFTRGTTESINLVMQSWGRTNIGAGDEVLISAIEHHSNIVPWQMLAQEKGATVRVIPVNDAGDLLVDEYERMRNPRVKLVAVGHASNALGTINPVHRIVAAAHANGSLVLIDGAQGVPHMRVDVRDLIYGGTPLDWADHGGRTEIAEYLRGRPQSSAAATS